MEFMDDLKISNEIAKEHLMDLCCDNKLCDKFKNLDSQKKTAFTRAYNKSHKEVTAVKKGKGPATKLSPESESDDNEDYDSMMDEDELDAIIKGK
jgi:hypothetical protein